MGTTLTSVATSAPEPTPVLKSDYFDISITVEVVTLDIPRENVLSQAFDKIRSLPNYLKPIVMEGLAKKLKVSKKAIDKSFELWMMERISQIALTDAAQNNGEEV